MEKISSGISPQPAISKFEESVVAENQVKNKLKKGFLNYAGIFVGVFLMFAVVVIVTTDISLTSFEEMAARLGDYVHRGVVMPEGYTLLDLYRERAPLYEKYADIVVDGRENISETLGAILAALGGEVQ